jgi:hypothetical protein
MAQIKTCFERVEGGGFKLTKCNGSPAFFGNETASLLHWAKHNKESVIFLNTAYEVLDVDDTIAFIRSAESGIVYMINPENFHNKIHIEIQ